MKINVEILQKLKQKKINTKEYQKKFMDKKVRKL